MTESGRSQSASTQPQRPAAADVNTAGLRQLPFLAGLALVTAATLALEVLDTRLLSVITWYSLAFLVIAMGLFGLTAGALHVYLKPEEFTPERLGISLARRSGQFALTIPLSLILVLCLPLATAPIATTVALFVLFALALALPFYPAGMVVAAALTRTSLPVGRVYAVDLIGAAFGAPLVPWLLVSSNGETAILAIAVVASLAAWAFARAADHAPAQRRSLWLIAGTLALCLLNGMSSFGLKPIWVKGRLDLQQYDLELWNSHSRIRAWPKTHGPAPLWGQGSRCIPSSVGFRLIEIDAGAGTAMYDAPHGMNELGFLTCDVTDVANLLRPGGPAAIIGVGGTRDLQAALMAQHAPVYGIELNARMLELIRSPLGQVSGIPTHPQVQLVHDEGRSYLSRSREQFHVVQASLIDTWAATGAGAHALGENGLYTVEAWHTFMSRLDPTGVLSVSRWTQETLRVASLATASLFSMGAAPRANLILVGTPFVITAILGRAPFDRNDIMSLHRIAEDKGFSVVVAPGEPVADPLLRRIVDAPSPAALDARTVTPFADNRPPTDERPYFFNVLPVEAAWRQIDPVVNMGSIEGNQLATRTLVLSFLASLVLVVGAILVPLTRRARPRGHNDRYLYAGIAYFALIGAGFMIAEIALLQRLSLVLGDPVYSLIVVVSSLVASTGLGSLISDRLPLTRAPLCYVYPLAIALALVIVAAIWPQLSAFAIAATTPVRIAIAVALCASLGCLFGSAFPAGMRFAKRGLTDETPWFWGMNGIGSVLASSLSVIVAQRWGLTVTLLTAAGCYIVLLVPITVWAAAPESAKPPAAE
jgi:hypothetical protein